VPDSEEVLEALLELLDTQAVVREPSAIVDFFESLEEPFLAPNVRAPDVQWLIKGGCAGENR
jgi:hypothetical protein